MLRFMGSQRVGHDWLTELNWKQTYLQIYRVRKANLVTDYRLVKVKVKHRSDQTCSLFSLSSLFSGKNKKKNLIPFFPLFTAALSLVVFIFIFLDYCLRCDCLNKRFWFIVMFSENSVGILSSEDLQLHESFLFFCCRWDSSDSFISGTGSLRKQKAMRPIICSESDDPR